MQKNLRLEDLEVYKVAMEIGDLVWEWVLPWDYFARNTLGNQIVRSADSIGLNIAEGYGRFHYKENKNFCYYSRGSAKETIAAATKAFSRKLINEEQYKLLNGKLGYYFKLMYPYIKSIGTTSADDSNV